MTTTRAATTLTSLGATDACPRVCAHMAYADVKAPFQTVTAPNTSHSSGFEARAEKNLPTVINKKICACPHRGENKHKVTQTSWI